MSDVRVDLHLRVATLQSVWAAFSDLDECPGRAIQFALIYADRVSNIFGDYTIGYQALLIQAALVEMLGEPVDREFHLAKVTAIVERVRNEMAL